VKQLHLHSSKTDQSGKLVNEDRIMDTPEQPGHDELCFLEQEYFLNSIKNDFDLSDHLQEVVDTLKIVLASDESVKTGRAVEL
jgi:hypothetical protein